MNAADSKLAAQRRADEIAAFRAELARLQEEGALALTAEQRASLERHHADLLAALAARFDVDVARGERQLSLGMRVASFLGAVALAASAALFFHRIWGMLATPMQVGVLIAAPALAIAATAAAARRDRTGHFASLFGLLAFGCFVLDLIVVSKIFNLPPSPHSLLAWGMLAAVLGGGYRLRWLAALAAGCCIAWLAAVLVSAAGGWWTAAFDLARAEAFFPGAAVGLAIGMSRWTASAELAAPVRAISWSALFVALLVLAGESGSSLLPLSEEITEALYVIVGLAAGAAAVALGIRRGWAESVHLGSGFLTVLLLVKYFDWWWDWMPRYLFFLVVGLTALAALWGLRRARSAMQRQATGTEEVAR